MATDLQRVSITLTKDMSIELERLKRRYYNEKEGEILRLLLREGMSACRKDDGNIYLQSGEEVFSNQLKKEGRLTFIREMELPTDAITAEFGRFYVCGVIAEYDGSIRKVKVNKIVNEESCWEEGYLTVDNVLYLKHESTWHTYQIDGKIIRGRQPSEVRGSIFLPLFLKKSEQIEDAAELSFKGTLNSAYKYYFCCTTERLYRYEDGVLIPQRRKKGTCRNE